MHHLTNGNGMIHEDLGGEVNGRQVSPADGADDAPDKPKGEPLAGGSPASPPIHYLPTMQETEECPTCSPPSRETHDMVCPTCGKDYS
jgi:hypothetical protein